MATPSQLAQQQLQAQQGTQAPPPTGQVPAGGGTEPVQNMGTGTFQNYQDAAYDQAQRTIAPQQQAQQKKFEQQMVNKGLTPGSQAYNLAQSQMQRGQNDQNNSATFGSMQFGQQAQQQAFGQDLQNRQFGLSQDKFGENQRQFDLGLGQRESEFGRNMGQRESEFGRNFGEMQGQNNFNNMMGMGDFGMRLADFSNRNSMQDYNQMEGMLSHAPGGSFNPIDTNQAYSNSMQGAANANTTNAANYGAMIGAVGNVASAAAMPSALEFKILNGVSTQAHRNRIAAKMLTMPVYSWDYKPQYAEKGDKRRFGVLANDFNRHFVDDEDEQTIDLQRYTAALHVTIQEMFAEVHRLELLLWHVADVQNIPMDARPYKGRTLGKVFDMADVIDKKPESWTPVGEA